jgi:hypothetical protein
MAANYVGATAALERAVAGVADCAAIVRQTLCLTARTVDAGEPVAAIVVRHARLAAFAFVDAGHQIAHLMAIVDETTFPFVWQAVGAAAMQLLVAFVLNAALSRIDIAVRICPARTAQAAEIAEDVCVCTRVEDPSTRIFGAEGHAAAAVFARHV